MNRAALCPVLACTPGGYVLVMATAEPISEEEFAQLLHSGGLPRWHYVPLTEGEPFEYKAADWGRWRGRVVALDYSAPALDD